MVVVGGTYRLTPESGELLVKTGRTGMGRRAPGTTLLSRPPVGRAT